MYLVSTHIHYRHSRRLDVPDVPRTHKGPDYTRDAILNVLLGLLESTNMSRERASPFLN